jgi:hypothetical protein
MYANPDADNPYDKTSVTLSPTSLDRTPIQFWKLISQLILSKSANKRDTFAYVVSYYERNTVTLYKYI